MRLPFIWVLLLASLLANTPARAQEVQRIAAVVNDEVISVFDVNARLSLVIASSGLKNRPEIRRRLGPQVLRTLIDERLKMQEAKRLDLKVGKRDIDKALGQIERQNNVPKGQLKKFLARQGVDITVLIDRIEASVAWVKVVSRSLRSRVEIGQDEIDETIAEIEANKGKPEHRVEEIFLPVDNPETEKDVRTVAERLLQQLKSGAKFAEMARSFSQSASAAKGGDLGWMKSGQLGEDLGVALLKMQPGQISRPIRSLAGFHILRLRDRRAAAGLTQTDSTVDLRQLFIPLPANPDRTAVAGGMDMAARLAARARTCQDMANLEKETGSPLSGSLGKIKVSMLPAQFRSVVKNLPVNNPSQPLRSGEGIVVLMVCGREGGEKPSVSSERKKIKEMLMQKRLEMAARQYLRDLRRAAFVDVRI